MRRLFLISLCLIGFSPAGSAQETGAAANAVNTAQDCNCDPPKPALEIALCKVTCRPPVTPSDPLKGLNPSIMVPNAAERLDLRGQVE